MSVQPAASPNLRTSKEVFTSAAIEKQLLENIDLLQGQELLVKPHFGEVLSNLNEVQSKPLPSKNVDSKAKGQADPIRARSRQDSDPVSHDSLVKNKTLNKKDNQKANGASENPKAQTAIKSRVSSTDSMQRDKESLKGIQQQSDINSEDNLAELLHPLSDQLMPICLNGEFICDTLQGINARQALALDSSNDIPSAIRGAAPISEILSVISNLTDESAVPQIHIEVQAAAIHADPLLDDQQINVITNLAAQDAENTELTAEQELALVPATDADAMEEEKGENHSFNSERQLKIPSKQEEQSRSQTAEYRSISREEIWQAGQGRESQSLQASPQSTSSISSLSSLNIQGSLGGAAAAGGKSEVASFTGVMSQSNLNRVNTLMQVKDHFRSLLKNQESHLKVNLMPESLGSIEITIDIVKDTVMATFIKAERRETMELLARHAEDIDKIFQESGLQSNLANMNFSSNQDQQLGREETSHQTASTTLDRQAIEEASLTQESDINPDALVDIKA